MVKPAIGLCWNARLIIKTPGKLPGVLYVNFRNLRFVRQGTQIIFFTHVYAIVVQNGVTGGDMKIDIRHNMLN